MEYKALFAILSAALAFISYIPYAHDMLRGRTKPHLYTWLIWSITTGTATVALWYGGGGYGAISQTFATILTVLFLILSFRYGTKNVTRGDTAVLAIALLAIVLWWLLDNPLLAVFMVTGIDVFGYIPSYRKSFEEPWSETVFSWFLFTLSNTFALLSLSEYNLLTTTYLLVAGVATNLVLILICLVRRLTVPKPASR